MYTTFASEDPPRLIRHEYATSTLHPRAPRGKEEEMKKKMGPITKAREAQLV